MFRCDVLLAQARNEGRRQLHLFRARRLRRCRKIRIQFVAKCRHFLRVKFQEGLVEILDELVLHVFGHAAGIIRTDGVLHLVIDDRLDIGLIRQLSSLGIGELADQESGIRALGRDRGRRHEIGLHDRIGLKDIITRDRCRGHHLFGCIRLADLVLGQQYDFWVFLRHH